jgi:hypothetical protein
MHDALAAMQFINGFVQLAHTALLLQRLAALLQAGEEAI